MFKKISRFFRNFAVPLKKSLVSTTFQSNDCDQVTEILGQVANLSTSSVDENDSYINRLIDQAKKQQEELLRLKEIKSEPVKVRV